MTRICRHGVFLASCPFGCRIVHHDCGCHEVVFFDNGRWATYEAAQAARPRWRKLLRIPAAWQESRGEK